MFAALLLAAFSIGTLALPHIHQRDESVVVETITDFVYVYDVVTVTATDGGVSSTSILASTTTTTSLVTSSSVNAPSIQNHILGIATSTPEQIFSPLPSPATSSPPAAPTVVSSAYSTSLPSVPTPVAAAAPASSAPAPAPNVVAPATQQRQVTGYNALALAHHNIHRRNHSAPDLIWSDQLAYTASKIANSCVYAHDVTTDRDAIGGYGQNIAAGVGGDNISVIITDLFYNGEVNWYDGLYGQTSPSMDNFEHWGHMSQMVWRDTTAVGCYTSYCPNGLAKVGSNVPPFFTVCNYQSPGNIAGQYNRVGQTLGQPTVTWNYFN